MAARGRRTWGRRRRSQWRRGGRRYGQGGEERMVIGMKGKREAQRGGKRCGDATLKCHSHDNVEMKRKADEYDTRDTSGRDISRDCGIACALKTERKPDGTGAIQSERNSVNDPSRTNCAIQITNRQSTSRCGKCMKRQKGIKLVNVWICICGIGITWLRRRGKGRARAEQGEHKKNKRGVKSSAQAVRSIQLRRLIQQRIRRWNKTRKVKSDDKDRKKYRHKARASLRWIRRKCGTNAKEANIRESKNRAKEK
eukprot:3499174-Pleurochrysis_carterae.AAC.1